MVSTPSDALAIVLKFKRKLEKLNEYTNNLKPETHREYNRGSSLLRHSTSAALRSHRCRVSLRSKSTILRCKITRLPCRAMFVCGLSFSIALFIDATKVNK